MQVSLSNLGLYEEHMTEEYVFWGLLARKIFQLYSEQSTVYLSILRLYFIGTRQQKVRSLRRPGSTNQAIRKYKLPSGTSKTVPILQSMYKRRIPIGSLRL